MTRQHQSGFHIAQFNWGVLRHDWDDLRVADFTTNIDRVNEIADRYPGFVWRLGDDAMEAQQLDSAGPIDWCDNARVASTLSVWKNMDSLRKFVFSGVHGQFRDRGSEWLIGVDGWPRVVMWPVAVGHRPSVAEGVNRLKALKSNGAGPKAFGFEEW